jgi:transcriptional regulator with XRE-family HTH domain
MNNLSVGERVTILRESLKLKPKDFAAEINVSQPTISRVEGNVTSPSKGFLLALTKHFAVNPDWILTGEGEMFFGAKEYIGSGIKLFGDQEMCKGLANLLEDPGYAKFHALVKAGDIVQSDIDEELAVYLQYILKMWHEGERDRHWVMKQLGIAFREVAERLDEEKKE